MSCRGSQSSPGSSCRAVCLTSSLSTNRLRRCSAWTIATRIHSIRGGRRGKGLVERERYSITQLFINISHFLLDKNAHTHKHLNPSKVRADQKWRKTGSERNEDSIITKAAEFGLPKPLSILPFITTNKPGTSFLITIFLTASAIFNRHAVSLEFKSL